MRNKIIKFQIKILENLHKIIGVLLILSVLILTMYLLADGSVYIWLKNYTFNRPITEMTVGEFFTAVFIVYYGLSSSKKVKK